MEQAGQPKKIRMLCLHGIGSNSQVFEAQTAALRNELGDDFEWHFVEGTIPVPIDQDLKGFYPEEDEYFSYFDVNSGISASKAIDDLESYVSTKGPFDVVLGNSQSSTVAASLILRHALTNSDEATPFKGAIFFQGIAPMDFRAMSQDEVRFLTPEAATGNMLIGIPTTNIWGSGSVRHQGMSDVLNEFCQKEVRETVVHSAGNEIPGAGNEEVLVKAVHAIRRTIDRAILAH